MCSWLFWNVPGQVGGAGTEGADSADAWAEHMKRSGQGRWFSGDGFIP